MIFKPSEEPSQRENLPPLSIQLRKYDSALAFHGGAV